MAIDRDTSFSIEKQNAQQDGMSSILSARNQRRADINAIKNGEGNEYLKMLQDQIKALETLNNLRDTDNKKLKEANKLLKEQEDFQLKKDADYEKYLKSLQEVFKITKELSDAQYTAELKLTKEITNVDAKKRAIKKLEDDEINRQRVYNNLLKQANTMYDTNKQANKSMLDSFTNGLHNLKSEIRDLAVIKGVGDITQGIYDKGNSASMYSVYKSTSAQLGISNSEFNSFKNSLHSQLAKSDNFFNYGWKDTADYLNKLGELNITSQEMAEQQYLAVLQGTKYLGLQTETQGKVLKIAKDTGRMDLLQSTNETLVQIMNAQLGISKDQLNQMVSQSASIADMSVFLGGNGDALEQLTKIQAAVTREYGKPASDAATNILSEILNNPADNKYLRNGFLAGNYNQIVQYAQSGQMDEAIKAIITSVQDSRSLQVARSNMYAANALGADSNILALGNASGNMGNVEANMASINSASNDIAATIKQFNQDWSDKILNAGSNILAMLPFSQVLSLQNVYYALATVELLIKVPKLLGGMLVTLQQIARNTGMTAAGIDPKNMGIGGMLTKMLPAVLAISAGIAALSMFVNDYSKGKSKAEEWGTTKSSAAIGGAIGGTSNDASRRTIDNMKKYALAGAALGFVFPGVGHLVGATVGGLIGLALGGTTGAIGGKNIASFLDYIKGAQPSNEGMGAAPSTPLPSTGGKGAVSNNSFPWKITSGFGPRTLGNGDNSYHYGVDFGIKKGTPIGAPISGTIQSTVVDNRNTYPNGPTNSGSGIYLQGDDGIVYQFWHLNSVGVKKGQRVNAGQQIGLSGNTGYSSGAHLHFGTKIDGSWTNPTPYASNYLFNASENGVSETSDTNDIDSVLGSKEGEKLLESVISADTLSSKAAGSYGMGAPGDNSEVVYAINTGFAGLNSKLEELSSRQDNQEEVLRQLTSGSRSGITSY